MARHQAHAIDVRTSDCAAGTSHHAARTPHLSHTAQALWSVLMQRSALLLVTLRAMPHGEVCMVPAAGGGGGYASSLAPAFVVNGTNQGREVERPTIAASIAVAVRQPGGTPAVAGIRIMCSRRR